MTATLSISRQAPDDIQDRTLRLWLDGEALGHLPYGQTLVRDIAPGPHVVKAHNTLFGATVRFDASAGEHIRLRTANGLTGGGKLMILMLGAAYLRVRLERVPPDGGENA